MITDPNLRKLYEFQAILCDMQLKIIKTMNSGVPKERIADSITLYDELHKVYEHYDRLYFNAFYVQTENDKLKRSLIETADRIRELEEENTKFKQSLEWES